MKMITIRLFITLLCMTQLYTLHSEELLDLEHYSQEFILETKRIIIPGFNGAFNASVTRWHDALLLCFRVRDANMVSNFKIGYVWLDKDFNPVGTARILEIRNDDPRCLSKKQDPRLIVVDQKLYIVYSDSITIDSVLTRRMFVAEMHEENNAFFIDRPICFHPFDDCSKRWEKNWVPFDYQNQLLLAYSLLPHRIFQPLFPSGRCITHSSTSSSIDWNWGTLRGGTPAVLDGDHYIAFFHSSTSITTPYSNGKKMTHYVMGAYTFSAHPPFNITRISPAPIVDKTFYSSTPYTTWKPLRVVFPMGCLIDEDYIWVTYGKQDFEIWVMKIDKQRFYNSLIDCPQTTQIVKKKKEPYGAFSQRDMFYEDPYYAYLEKQMFDIEHAHAHDDITPEEIS